MIVFDIVKISLTASEIAIKYLSWCFQTVIKQWFGIFIISIYITSHWLFGCKRSNFQNNLMTRNLPKYFINQGQRKSSSSDSYNTFKRRKVNSNWFQLRKFLSGSRRLHLTIHIDCDSQDSDCFFTKLRKDAKERSNHQNFYLKVAEGWSLVLSQFW